MAIRLGLEIYNGSIHKSLLKTDSESWHLYLKPPNYIVWLLNALKHDGKHKNKTEDEKITYYYPYKLGQDPKQCFLGGDHLLLISKNFLNCFYWCSYILGIFIDKFINLVVYVIFEPTFENQIMNEKVFENMVFTYLSLITDQVT